MNSKIVEFVYVSEKGEMKARKVFLMNETDTYIQGFELSYLSMYSQRKLKKTLATHRVRNVLATKANSSSTKIGGLNDMWIHKAWRTFKKSNICDEYMTKKQLINEVVERHLASNKHSAKNNINDVLSNRCNRKTAYGMSLHKVDDNILKVSQL